MDVNHLSITQALVATYILCGDIATPAILAEQASVSNTKSIRVGYYGPTSTVMEPKGSSSLASLITVC